MSYKKLITLSLLIAVSVLSRGNSVSAATRTWTGAGSNTNMATPENWSGDVAPTASDSLVFPQSASVRTVVNNYSAGTTFGTISFSGSYVSGSNYVLSGNSITLTGGILNEVTGGSANATLSLPIELSGLQAFSAEMVNSIYVTGVLSGGGGLSITGDGTIKFTGNNTFTGGANVSNGATLIITSPTALGVSANTRIFPESQMVIQFPEELTDATISGTFYLAHDTNDPERPSIFFDAPCDSDYCDDYSVTFDGYIYFDNSTTIRTNANVNLNSVLSGSYAVNMSAYSSGLLTIDSPNNQSATPNGIYERPITTITYDANSPDDSLTIAKNIIGIVTGTYKRVFVEARGVLKGTGKFIEEIYVGPGGIVAPGNSPGCLSSGDLMIDGGEYQAEIQGTTACSEYDQLKVSGTVVLKVNGVAPKLRVSLPGQYKPKAGSAFTIIDNDGTDAVDGIFGDLPEGATLTVDGFVFKISYKGGDGNDVTLTLQTVPSVPATGFMLLKNNPFAVLVVTTAAASGILALSKYSKSVGKLVKSSRR